MKIKVIPILFVFMTFPLFAQVELPPAGQSTYVVNNGQTISITDGQSITLGPGTHIHSGAIFSAQIIEITTATDPYTSINLSNDENYIFTRSYYKPMPSFSTSNLKEGDVMESITYFDGLGRSKQAIGIKKTPDKKDLITHLEYDDYGRQAKEWLPYHESTGILGTYRGDKASATRSYYKSNYGADFPSLSISNVNAYAEKEFEPSPFSRVLKQAATGEDWKLGNGHEIVMEYKTNSAFEVYRFQVNTTFANNTYTPSLVHNNIYYGAGELYKTVTKDENWTSGTDHTTQEFTDKQGRVVLKRTFNPGAHDTYYVYDDFGNLTYVIPPKVTISSISTTELNGLCYQYKYDYRNRLVEKKIPGKEWESIVYNKMDQPIMAQDPNLDAQNKWLFTKYDAFGRVTYTGIDTGNSSSRISVQSSADNGNDQNEIQTASPTTYAGTPVYYTKTAYPTSFDQVYTINYYDTYVDTDGLSVPATVLGQAKAANTQGLATVSKVRVLHTNDWITTITGYDIKGRPIYTATKNNYLNTTDITETELDFGGRVLRTRTIHKKTGKVDIVTEDIYTYDHEGRLLRQKQTINGQGQKTIADNTYDNLGQLTQKTVGGGLQTVDYDYNVRGWLKSINDVAALGTDLFAFDINYNTIEYDATSIPLYNGNISETVWKTKNDEASQPSYFIRGYSFGYDALNRIKRGYTFTKSGANTYASLNYGSYGLNNVDYDKNGNITALIRSGQYGYYYIDNLDYDYDEGNKLLKVTDNGSSYKAEGFNDGANSATEYIYDANGNMIIDRNKGITGISYNHLNLPTNVVMTDGNIQYIYDAAGIKIKKIVNNTSESSLTTTEYAGNYIYENDNLQFFGHAEGYVSVENGSYKYVYEYKDHLGNTRLSYTDADGNGSIATNEIVKESNYYPFGSVHRGYNNNVSSHGNSVGKRYMFGGNEYDESLGINTYDFGERNYDPDLGRWFNIDPFAEFMRNQSPFNFGFNNPIYFSDYAGTIPWPLPEFFKNWIRKVEPDDIFRRRSRNRFHYGLDLNYNGGGNTDHGAPIVATHDGRVARVIPLGKNDGGGRIVVIESPDKSFQTKYMHLSYVTVQPGQEINEGQTIGLMGRSGFGKELYPKYKSHLHYEIHRQNSDGSYSAINPWGNGAPIDPQRWIPQMGPFINAEAYNFGSSWSIFDIPFTAPDQGGQTSSSGSSSGSGNSGSSTTREPVSPVPTTTYGPVVIDPPLPSGGTINPVVPGGGNNPSPPIIIPPRPPDSGF